MNILRFYMLDALFLITTMFKNFNENMYFVRKITQLIHKYVLLGKKNTIPFSNLQFHPFLSPRNEHCFGFDEILREHFHILTEYKIYTYSVFLLKYSHDTFCVTIHFSSVNFLFNCTWYESIVGSLIILLLIEI